MKPLTLTVHGTPAPQGSKRHVGNGVMVESSKRVKPWREAVKHAALDALRVGPEDEQGMAERIGFPFGTAPVEVSIAFALPRPRSHYRTGKNAHLLRDDAPEHVGTRPDLDKLIRSTLDALGEAGVWRDDCQVASLIAVKNYTSNAPYAFIAVKPLDQVAS